MTLKEFIGKITSRYLWGNCLGVIIVAALLAVGGFVFLSFYTHHGEEIEMPDVRGRSIEVATRKLEALGLRVTVSDTGYVNTLAPDVVLEQNIMPGHKVKQNRLVSLIVNSAQARTIALPDLADNSSLREAEAKLRAMGFKLGATERITGDRDWVYAVKVNGREVSAGSRVSVDQLVTLVAGDGLTEDEFNGNDSLDYLYFYDPDTLDAAY